MLGSVPSEKSVAKHLVGTFDDEHAFISAIRQLKKKRVAIKNVFTPYPIHQVFEELELKTRFPYLATVYGVFGTLATFAALWYTSVFDFPVMIGGKPHLSLSFIVIMFVMTINIGVVLSVVSFFVVQNAAA